MGRKAEGAIGGERNPGEAKVMYIAERTRGGGPTELKSLRSRQSLDTNQVEKNEPKGWVGIGIQ